jgi:hypothetical protein
MGRTACTQPQCLYRGALYLYLYLNQVFIRQMILSQCLYFSAAVVQEVIKLRRPLQENKVKMHERTTLLKLKINKEKAQIRIMLAYKQSQNDGIASHLLSASLSNETHIQDDLKLVKKEWG